MIKVKLFYHRHTGELEKAVNDWIEATNPIILNKIHIMRLDDQGKPHFLIALWYKEVR